MAWRCWRRAPVATHCTCGPFVLDELGAREGGGGEEDEMGGMRGTQGFVRGFAVVSGRIRRASDVA